MPTNSTQLRPVAPTLLPRLCIVILFFAVGFRHVSAEAPSDGAPVSDELTLLDSWRVWDRAPHNAFTDLLRHQDRWYLVFREGRAHVSPDGALRVLTSKDGKKWQSLSLVESSEYDLRDAKICVTPTGELLLNGAGMKAKEEVRYYSLSWLSKDGGKSWSEANRIGAPGDWLWRVQWRRGIAYSMGYSTQRDRTTRSMRLYRSKDGRKFETWIDKVSAPAGCGEDKILFLADDSAVCLLRHETGDKMAQLGTSKPPYKSWKWRSLNLRIGGPNMIQLPDGRILAATRLYSGGTRTSLSWLDLENGALTEALRLPSGGDTSYPGLVLHDGVLWVSYYSSHEGKSSIYMAKVGLPPQTIPTSLKDTTFIASHDGSAQKYVAIMPTGFDAKRTTDVLIALHGHGSDRWQFARHARDECRAVRDAAARHGMLLICPDYRAKTSWMGPSAEADVLQIIQSLKRKSKIGRVIVAGGSMGGTGALTFAALHPGQVDGIVSMNGTADLVHYQRFADAIADSFGGTRDEVPERYKRRSALYSAEKLTMPLAVTTGGRDSIVPAASVLALVDKVQQLNSKTLSIHRPEGGHSTSYADATAALEFVIGAAKANGLTVGFRQRRIRSAVGARSE